MPDILDEHIVITDPINYSNIAASIRRKNGESTLYKPSEMSAAIDALNVSGVINLQDKTVNPSTSQQSLSADTGYDGLGVVTINAMPSGTAGTPVATKGTVSNNSISVTPSVTNTTGYITGGTKTGTAVTVSAGELVSGTKTISTNGNNIDVTNYALVNVNVSGGGGSGGAYQDANGYVVLNDDGGGIAVVPLSVTENGTYTAPTNTGYSPVTVSVAGGATFGGTITITVVAPNTGGGNAYYLGQDGSWKSLSFNNGSVITCYYPLSGAYYKIQGAVLMLSFQTTVDCTGITSSSNKVKVAGNTNGYAFVGVYGSSSTNISATITI